MFRLWSITKYAGAFVSAMEAIIQSETIRVPSEPPQEEVALVEAFKKSLAEVDHEYLSRLRRKSRQGRAPKQSKYHVAMLEYLALFNAPPDTDLDALLLGSSAWATMLQVSG